MENDNSSSSKMVKLMKLLDNLEVETNEQEKYKEDLIRKSTNLLNSDAINNLNELKNKITNLSIELNEANKTIDVMKKLIENEKKNGKINEKKIKEIYEMELKEQKRELESIIERHLTMIDKLIQDKKKLNDDIETLYKNQMEKEEYFGKVIKELHEKYKLELKNCKNIWNASEKNKKEKWLEEKTKEIKQITIKGKQIFILLQNFFVIGKKYK